MVSRLLYKYVLILIVCIAIPGVLFAGTTGKIAGKITDADTQEALPGANVTIVGTNMGAATNVDGEYFILNIPPGNYSVRITMMGY